MGYAAREKKFDREYAVYNPEVDKGLTTRVLPAVLNQDYIVIVEGKIETVASRYR